jgi:putative endonuclease
MHYVYIIKSKKDGSIYIGCASDLKKRLKQHNNGKAYYTKNKIPWEVRYYEAFYSEKDAFAREQKLKNNARGLQELKKRLKNTI